MFSCDDLSASSSDGASSVSSPALCSPCCFLSGGCAPRLLVSASWWSTAPRASCMRCWGRAVRSPHPSWSNGPWASRAAWTTYTCTKSSTETSSLQSKTQHVVRGRFLLLWAGTSAPIVCFLSSMLITHDDMVKISDFGTSKELSDKSTKMSFAGTVAWMAPEVIRNEPVSEKVDIWWVRWAFFCFFLLKSTVLARVLNQRRLFLLYVHDGVRAEFQLLVHRC